MKYNIDQAKKKKVQGKYPEQNTLKYIKSCLWMIIYLGYPPVEFQLLDSCLWFPIFLYNKHVLFYNLYPKNPKQNNKKNSIHIMKKLFGKKPGIP